MKKACLTKGEQIWTLTYNVNRDNSVTILNFDNADNDGYMFQEQLATLDEVTIKDRIATHVTIDGEKYVVSNPQDVYTYKQPL